MNVGREAVSRLTVRVRTSDHDATTSGNELATSGKLEPSWMNKDKVLISPKEGRYDYIWVESTDFRAREIRLSGEVDCVTGEDRRPENVRGEDELPEPTADNLIF